MQQQRSRAVVLFAKSPTPGQVKTRMMPVLSTLEAADLAAAFLQDAAEKLRHVPAEAKMISFTPADGEAAVRALGGSDFEYFPQAEGDLGCRMAAAFDRVFHAGHGPALILGADSPTLPESWISEALESLRSCDVALGPTYDGGYYLIGLRQPVPALFSNIPWSTPGVLRGTLEVIARECLILHLLPVWYDVDRPEDLEFLRLHLRALELAGGSACPKATAVFFRSRQGISVQ